jgi:hypothetical protein
MTPRARARDEPGASLFVRDTDKLVARFELKS